MRIELELAIFFFAIFYLSYLCLSRPGIWRRQSHVRFSYPKSFTKYAILSQNTKARSLSNQGEGKEKNVDNTSLNSICEWLYVDRQWQNDGHKSQCSIPGFVTRLPLNFLPIKHFHFMILKSIECNKNI